jgi:F-type H+-transporting ATPase subunit delta
MPLIEAQPDAVATTYAKSLLDSLKFSGGSSATIETALAELQAVLDMARNDKGFSEFLASRIISAEARDGALQRIFGGKLAPTTVNFLRVLNDKGRLSSLPGIVTAFEHLAQESFGNIEVYVSTTTPLSDDEKNRLTDRLRAALKSQPILHCTIDPSMIGGIRIQIGDHLIDASVVTKLAQVRENLASTGLARARAAADKILAIG